MITLFTGMPGAGKTAALVELLSALPKDRPLFVDGLEGLTLEHTACDAHNWPEELPDGAILVIDEVQRVWRPRGPGSKVPSEVAALETHRHRGIDIFLTTQAPRLLDANVRGLVGRHVHIRDTGWLGRYWYEWPEVNDSMSWKTCPVKKKYKLPKKAFDLYKSASIHTKPERMTPVVLYLAILAVIGAIVGVFMVYRVLSSHKAEGEVKPELPGPSRPASTPGPVQSQSGVFSTAMGSTGGVGQQVRMIDDRVDFIPRVSGKPESAPAYDHLRVIVQMPVVAGGYCTPSYCTCITQQGTDPGLSQHECRQWIEHKPFYPYAPTVVADGNSLERKPSSANLALPGQSAAGTPSRPAVGLLASANPL